MYCRHQLGEAESALIEQEAEHRRELELLEEEIDTRRRGEARSAAFEIKSFHWFN